MKESEISIHKVDASEYICWTEGLMVFNKEPLDSVFSRLSRYYGQEIRYENREGKLYCVTGKLDLRGSLEDVMKLVAGFAPITFNKENDIVTVELIEQ